MYPLGLGFFRLRILTMMKITRMKTTRATPKTMYNVISVTLPLGVAEETIFSPLLSSLLPYITSCPESVIKKRRPK